MVNRKHDDEIQDDLEFTSDESETIDPELEVEDEQPLDTIKKLRSELKESKHEKMQALEELQRNRADFLNARKRAEEQLIRDRERLVIRHIEELLPVIDSFDMAISDPKWVEADEIWRKGVEGIYGQLMTILRNNGVVAISPLGEAFNPHEHEALTDSGSNDTVSVVMQKGYKRNEEVIRPAKVGVGT